VKRILLILGLLLVLVLAAAAAAFAYTRQYLEAPLNVPATGRIIEVPAGSSFAAVVADLEAKNLTEHGDILRLYARWTGQAEKVQAGEYRIKAGTTPAGLLEQFTNGAVVLYSFTIVEGWTHRELLAGLQAQPEVVTSLGPDDWPIFLDELGSTAPSPEGLFLPETYHFPRGTTDRSVLTQAYRQMQTTLDEEWAARDEAAPVATPYEALVLASIVEKETARADERERIAGVFARRLDRHMRLQTDPTVIYGLGPGFNGNLTRRDLKTDTPYNTYTRFGLPPTPIAMPGRAAIHAALHPAAGEELYFVATGLGDGSHKFSATVEEHEQAVRDYLKRLRQNR
jgi:peptidoglycan lytic transglycosylase G